jgi:hypothetical protein
MPITESRLKSGTLTLDAVSFAAQASNVTIEPSTDEVGERLEVLSGDTIDAEDETSSVLQITAVQDFDDPTGFVRFTWTNKNELVPFSWQPNPSAPTISGTCRIRPVSIGGDVNTRLDTGAEFPISGDPTFTDPI